MFGNITDILLAEAENMNAKDERFISQGVYNMLYGTVELLMVSSEAAKEKGDSDTLSTDRSKVGLPKYKFYTLPKIIKVS